MRFRFAIALASILAAPAVAAASFDCSNAINAVEHAICGNSYIGQLDMAMNTNYRAVRDIYDDGVRKKLAAGQRDWLKDRDQCQTERCLIAMYKERIDTMCDVASAYYWDCIRSEEVAHSQRRQ